MTALAAKLVDEFKNLPLEDQRWVCKEILRVAPKLDYGPLTDEELTALADRTFVLLDKEEANAQPR